MNKGFRWLDVDLKRFILSGLLMILGTSGLSGQYLLKNQPKYDHQRLHFGFFLGVNYQNFHIQLVEDLPSVPGYYSVRTDVSPGYNINIVSNLRLTDHFDLRFNPGFASTTRTLFFDIRDPVSLERVEVKREVESSFIELPFELKLRSDRIGNYAMYVMAGVKYNMDLASKEDVEDDRVFKIKAADLLYEFTYGWDIYFEYFKFSPQIKASFGFANLKVEDETFLVEGIDKIMTRSIMISFTFE